MNTDAMEINRETLSGDALLILKNLRENGRQGRSNKLADVKAILEPEVSLEFDSYFFFLRKFHYIAMDREAQLKLTDQGEKVVEGDQMDKFSSEVGEFFSDQLFTNENTDAGLRPLPSFPPPPPNVQEDTDVRQSAPPPAGKPKRPTPVLGDEPALSSSHLTARAEMPMPPSSRDREPPTMAAPLPTASNTPAAMAGGNAPKGTDIDLRYVKFDPIGTGPLGTVYKGRHNALGLDICIKELKDIFGYFSFLQRGEVIKRLKRELCAQAQVRHPSVVAILDQNTEVARPYFVMELLKGSLKEKLEATEGKGLPVPLAIRYFLQLSYALRAAHAQGLTHHNIKPENVLFDSCGNAKLADFGLGRVIEVDQAKGMPQVFVGTGGMGYMSPELIARSKDVGPSADVYGLGILLYEILTGQIPGRRSPLPSEVNTDVPVKLDPIFDKMTQDRREKRYSDIDSVLEDFYKAFADGEYAGKNDLLLWSEPVGEDRAQ